VSDEDDAEEAEEEELNSAVKLVWQLWRMGDDEEARGAGWRDAMERDSAMVLLQHLAEPHAFNQLRTNEQLGYLVHTAVDMYNGVHLFSVSVQSAKVGPVELEERILAWLRSFRAQLADGTISDADVETNKRGLADAILKRPTCLADVVERDYQEIASRRYYFSRSRKRAHQLRDHTTREHVLKVLDDAVLHPTHARLLKSRVYAPARADDLARTLDDDGSDDASQRRIRLRSFDDIRRFQADQPRHPPPIRWHEGESSDDPAL